MRIKAILLFNLIILLSFEIYGQELESYPASIRWMQINTPHFRVIFPSDGTGQGQEAANILEHVYQPASRTLQASPRKIKVILNSSTAVSNGFVAYGPRRSELFLAPPQDYNLNGSNVWLPYVALHEYRHIVQFQKANTGFNKLSYLLFGQEAFNAMAVLATPTWFWEGDAVVTETALSHSGRGRLPEFDIEYRTPLLERQKPYSYYKQYLGSYKDFIPDHYRIGYFMTSYIRNKYGKDIWEPILHQANSLSFIPFTFSLAMKRNTGNYMVPSYKEMTNALKSEWEDNMVEGDKVSVLTRRGKNEYTNYLYPQLLEDGSVVALKEGLDDIQQFVILTAKGDEKIFIPGVLNRSPILSAKGNMIVWSEYVPDPRWPKAAYSVIKTYNIQSKEFRILTGKENFASADLSHDLSMVVTVRTTAEGISQIVVLQSRSGRVLKIFDNPDKAFYVLPTWSEDDKKLIAQRTTLAGKTLVIIDYETGREENLFPVSSENFGYAVNAGDFVLYNSPYNGVDNIYALKLSTGEQFQVTESKYGAYYPVVSKDKKVIYFNNYSVNGMEVVSMPFDPESWKKLSEVKDRHISIAAQLATQEGNTDLLKDIPVNNYPVKRYRKIRGIINPISWGPYLDATTNELFVGIRSRDALSTIAWDAGWVYNNADQTQKWVGSITYDGFYPQITSNLVWADRNENVNYYSFTDSTYHVTGLKWKEVATATGIAFPWNLTNGKYFTFFTLGNSVTYIHKYDYVNPAGDQNNILLLPSSQGNGNIIANNLTFYFSRLLRRSKRDINSRFGQYVIFRTSGTPYGGDFSGGITTLRAGLFFPGVYKHHSLYLRGGIQSRKLSLKKDVYRFPNAIEFPRGFGASSFENYYYGSVNYTLPLVYPDLAIGPIVYIQRVKANLFFDSARGENSIKGLVPVAFNYYSTGIEVSFDFNPFRLLTPFDLGFRVIYKNDPFGTGENPVSLEFLVGSFGF